MTSNLRKWHLFTWIGIVITIPILMILSIKWVPEFPLEATLEKKSIQRGAVIKSSENEFLKLTLKQTKIGYNIEINVIKPLKTPSAGLYTMNENNSKGRFIGQITAKGIYSFPADKNIKGIIIFDTIKEKEITKIQF